MEPRFVEWSTLGIQKTKSTWIATKNCRRRHLTPEQRGALWMACQNNAIQERQEMKRKGTLFPPGNIGGPGRGKKGFCQKCGTHHDRGEGCAKTVRTNSSEPFSPAGRDYKAEDARSTVGLIAAGADVSFHIARQAKAVVDSGDKELIEKVIAGAIQISDAAKQAKAMKPPKPRKPSKEKPLQERVATRLVGFIKSFKANEAEVKRSFLEQLQ
ncbi:MAG: hypothetical protein AB9869_10490 [Verrucomicrobiia bacterium]